MAKSNQEPVVESEVSSLPAPAEKGPLDVADYSLVGLEDQGDELYVPQLARSYTKEQLLIPAIAETLHRLGWPHIQKNQ